MITITQAAAKQIRRTADSGNMEDLALRIAASVSYTHLRAHET